MKKLKMSQHLGMDEEAVLALGEPSRETLSFDVTSLDPRIYGDTLELTFQVDRFNGPIVKEEYVAWLEHHGLEIGEIEGMIDEFYSKIQRRVLIANLADRLEKRK